MLHFFINSKCFWRFLSEKLATSWWFHTLTYLYFECCLQNIITEEIVLKINVYFYLTVPLCLKHNDVVYRWKALEKTNILTYNMFKSVAKYGCYYNVSLHTRYHKIDKNTTTAVSSYVNESVSRRTTFHLIEKKYQVTGHYLCTKYMLGCLELHFYECAMVE